MKYFLIPIAALALIGCAGKPQKISMVGIKASQTKVEQARKNAEQSLDELNKSIKRLDQQLLEAEKLTEDK